MTQMEIQDKLFITRTFVLAQFLTNIALDFLQNIIMIKRLFFFLCVCIKLSQILRKGLKITEMQILNKYMKLIIHFIFLQ